MPKKIIKKIHKSKDRKKQEESQEENQQQPSQQQQQPSSENNQNDSDQSGSEQENSSQQESSSITPVKPQDMAIRNMQFRQRRGTKMNYLINRKKQQEQDPFWAEMGQQYFGNLDQGDNDQQDYVQSSSGRDQFDSDFSKTQSQPDAEPIEDEKQIDEDKERQKKKRQELMRKIQAPTQRRATRTAPSISNQSTIKKVEEEGVIKKIVIPPQSSTKYIHQAFNQEQLLGEAATTQYFNWLSLKKLISLQTEKKDFTQRSHHIQGPKIIYRDRIDSNGKRECSYQLNQVKIECISQLTNLMKDS